MFVTNLDVASACGHCLDCLLPFFHSLEIELMVCKIVHCEMKIIKDVFSSHEAYNQLDLAWSKVELDKHGQVNLRLIQIKQTRPNHTIIL